MKIKHHTIIVLGDSLAQGFHDEHKGGWVEELKTHFMEDGIVSVFNLSVSGFTTEDILMLIKRGELESRMKGGFGKNVMFVVAVGSNDAGLHGMGRPVIEEEKFESNLKAIIQSLEAEAYKYAYQSDIMFLGLTEVDETRSCPVEWDKDLFYENRRIRRYDDIIGRVALNTKKPFIALIGAMPTPWWSDGVHWLPPVHRAVYSKVLGAIKNF